MLFAEIFQTFLPLIFGRLFLRFFAIFGQKWVQKGVVAETRAPPPDRPRGDPGADLVFFSFLGRFWVPFWVILGRFWGHFLTILGSFWHSILFPFLYIFDVFCLTIF